MEHFHDRDNPAEIVSDYQLKTLFSDFLDGIYPEVEVAGFEYSVSELMENADPVRFRVELSDFQDAFYRECDDPDCVVRY